MDRTDRPTPATWAGIEVSQDALDACLLPAPGGKPRERAFASDDAGHAALAEWADGHAAGATVGFCLESTGAYGEALATALADAGRHVAVVNPARVKYAGLARGQGNKTGRADAKLIAEYAARERPPAWQPPRPEVRELQGLSRRRDDLRRLAAGEQTRLAAPGLLPAVRKSITRTAALLAREADRLQAQADELVAGSERAASCCEPSPASGRSPPTPSWPSCPTRPASPPPSRRRPTPVWPRASSGPEPASGSGRGCPRRATPGSARRCTCRP